MTFVRYLFLIRNVDRYCWIKEPGADLFYPSLNTGDYPYSDMVMHRLFDTVIPQPNPGVAYDPEVQKVNPFLPRGKAPPLALLLSELPSHHFYAYLQSWSDTEAIYASSEASKGKVVVTFPFSPAFIVGYSGPHVCFLPGQLCSQFMYQIKHVIDDLVPDLPAGE